MGTFTYQFTTTNTVLNLTDTGNISIKTPTSPNTPGTGAYTITITETESRKSYNTNVTVNVKTLCKSINLNVNENINTLHNLSNVTNYKSYTIAYNVQYNSGNNYTVTNSYRAATYTVTSNPSSSGVKLQNGNLVIPQLYEGNITITATNSHNIDSTKSVSKTITTKVFKPKVTLNTLSTTYGTTPVTLTYSVESNAAVGAVTFDGVGKGTYYTINGQTLTPLKAGKTSIKTQYAKTTNFLAYTSNDIEFTINKRDGNVTFNPITKTYGDSNFYAGLTYTNWFGTITYGITATNQSISVDSTGYIRIAAVGTATVTATGTGDKNHNNFSKNATVTINKRSASSYTLTGATYTYGASPFNMQLTYGNWYGTPKYSVTAGGDYISITDAGRVTVKGAGTATVKVLGDGDNNHNDFTTNATITINKRSGKFTYNTKNLSYANKGTTYSIGLTYTNWFGNITYTITYNTGGDTISLSGDKISIVNAGDATIKVTATGDKNHNSYTAYISCNVKKADRTFRFAANPVEITYGNTHNMIAYEGNTTNKVTTGITYISYKESVAKVNNGVITPVAYGQAVIRGTWNGGRNYNSYYDEIIVNVERKDATLNLNNVTVTYNPNTTYQLIFTKKDTNGTISYKSGNTDVATVNTTSGLVTIKGAGSSTITIQSVETGQYKAKTNTCLFTVNRAPTELIVSNDSQCTQNDGMYNYSTSKDKYVLYACIVNTNTNEKLNITPSQINVDVGNNYFNTPIITTVSNNVLKFEFTVNSNAPITAFDTTLQFTFTDTSGNYENPSNGDVYVTIAKQSKAISLSPNNVKLTGAESSIITINDLVGRNVDKISVTGPASTILSHSLSGNTVRITSNSNPSVTTNANLTVKAIGNAIYNDASASASIIVNNYTPPPPPTPDPTPENKPTPGPTNPQPEQKKPYLNIDGRVAYSNSSITIYPGSSTKTFSVTAGDYTGSTNQTVIIEGNNVKSPSSFIAYNGCTLELKDATASTIYFKCSESNFNINQIEVEFNYLGDNGSVTPDGSITPGDDFSWGEELINEVCYVVVSSNKPIAVTDGSGNRLGIVQGNEIVLEAVGGISGNSAVSGEITINGSTATIDWLIENPNGNTKLIPNKRYNVVAGSIADEPSTSPEPDPS